MIRTALGPGQSENSQLNLSGDSFLESLVETPKLLNIVSTLEPTKPTSKLPCQYTLEVMADLQNSYICNYDTSLIIITV